MVKPKYSDIKITLDSCIILFLLLFVYFFAPAGADLSEAMFPLAAALALFYSLLGIVLVYLTIKREVSGRLKIFLLMAGIGAASFLPLVLLHNIFYALGFMAERSSLLLFLTEGLHISTFLLAVFAAPLSFLLGAGASKLIFFKNEGEKT